MSGTPPTHVDAVGYIPQQGSHLETRGVSAGIFTEVALVGLLASVDADVPRDLLPVLGGVLAV